MEIKVVATTGRAQGQAVEIKAAKFFIGHHENCQLRPDIPGLAGIHALIEQRDMKVFLRDFGAEGGTGINDRVLHARETEVFDGDLIQVGPLVLTLSIRSKADDSHHHALAHAPEGWPFLNESSEVLYQAASRRIEAPLAAPRHTPPPHSPPKAEPFAIPRPETVAAMVAVSHPAAATAQPTAPPSAPLLPILAKPPGRRALSCKMLDDVMVVTILSADLNEEETVSPVRYELRSMLDEEEVPARMVIDLGNTRYLSSRAVGVLLAHYQGLERKGGVLRVCGVSKEIKPVLDQMRLSMLIDIYPTVEDAVKDPWD